MRTIKLFFEPCTPGIHFGHLEFWHDNTWIGIKGKSIVRHEKAEISLSFKRQKSFFFTSQSIDQEFAYYQASKFSWFLKADNIRLMSLEIQGENYELILANQEKMYRTLMIFATLSTLFSNVASVHPWTFRVAILNPVGSPIFILSRRLFNTVGNRRSDLSTYHEFVSTPLWLISWNESG